MENWTKKAPPPVSIHPTAVLEGDVKLGNGVEIGAFCYLKGPLVIGENTKISPHCSIGTEAEHKTRPTVGTVFIGKNTVLRDGCVIHRGTGHRDTTIGDDCYIMNKCYIAHDSVIGNNVTISAHVAMGGHTTIQEGANLGIGAVLHQFTTIGAWAMVGMGASVARDVPPFALVLGNPMRFQRFNNYHFEKFDIELERDIRFKDGKIWIQSQHKILTDLFNGFKNVSTRKSLVEIVTF
jgi:UDP-N-acetylglucosamine acyltransferase